MKFLNPLTQKPATGAVLFEGPSMIDGAPIVVIAIFKSGNTKTGNMLQTYIIRSDMAPLDASKTGADSAICGNCPHRGTPTTDPAKKQAEKRPCYVNLGQGPTVVYKAYKAGKYPRVTDSAAINYIGAGRMVRLGTYGDPLAAPVGIWRQLVRDAVGHNGYTHQPVLAAKYNASDLVMMSADSVADAAIFKAQGKRYFRVAAVGSEKLAGEIHCPASKERGAKLNCIDCKMCPGTTGLKSTGVVIWQH